MASLALILLLILSAFYSVKASSGQCSPDSIPDSPLRAWKSSSKPAWLLSVRGRVLNSSSSSFLSGHLPSAFALDVYTVTSEGIRGSLFLSQPDSSTTATTTVTKGWNPRFRHGAQDRSRMVRGTLRGVYTPESNLLCAKVCLRRLSFNSSATPVASCNSLLSVHYPAVRSIDNLFVTGELRSLLDQSDPDFFSPLSLTGVSNQEYNYTKLDTAGRYCAGTDGAAGGMLRGLTGNSSVCHSGLRSVSLNMTRNQTCMRQGCYPFSNTEGRTTLFFDNLWCASDGRISGFLLLTDYYEYERRGSHLAGGENVLAVEGKWEDDRLCMVACQTGAVKDCSMLVTLQYPEVFTIHQRSPIVGSIRSLREKSDPLFFAPFKFGASGEIYRFYTRVRGQFRYEYTKLDEAVKQCGPPAGKAAEVYPRGEFFEDFYFRSTSSKGPRFNVYQVSLNNRLSFSSGGVGTLAEMRPGISEQAGELLAPARNVNVSFDITLDGEYISAEGFYDPSLGTACMIGCKAVNLSEKGSSESEHGKDCKIFVRIQYPPLFSGKEGERKISATISSLRTKKDDLFFKPITITSQQNMYMAEASEGIWMKDVEIFLGILTLSLVVVVLVFQLLHAKRQPKLRPYSSLVMLSVLALGHMVPLVLNFEAVFSRPEQRGNKLYSVSSALSPFGDGFLFQAEEVSIRLMNMAAFLLVLWLLHIVRSSRKPETTSGASSELSRFSEDAGLLEETSKEEDVGSSEGVREGKVLLVCLPLYVAGAVATSFRQWLLHRSLWSGLKSYAGLSLDMFLVPQLVAYCVWGIRVRALSPVFCLGMTVARLLPHAFDIYRVFQPSLDVGVDYYFANREWDFYSLAWDIAIPCGALVVALLVLLQQRFGGRCFIPGFVASKFR